MIPTRTRTMVGAIRAAAIGTIILLSAGGSAYAHCDTMGGPVIPEARAALDRGDVTPVLKWVKPEHEAELTSAFDAAMHVRGESAEAAALADRYFLETLIRLHRTGEGAPYNGLKDAPPEGIVALADEALADGSPDVVIKRLQDDLADALRSKFEAAHRTGATKSEAVTAGRAFVEAYVQYMHYVEGIQAAIAPAGVHTSEISPYGHATAKLEEHSH